MAEDRTAAVEAIRAACRAGGTHAGIAREHGVSRARVYKICGPVGRLTGVKMDEHKVYVRPGTFDRIKELTGRIGLGGRSPRPDAGPTVGALLDAIAAGDVEVRRVTADALRLRAKRAAERAAGASPE